MVFSEYTIVLNGPFYALFTTAKSHEFMKVCKISSGGAAVGGFHPHPEPNSSPPSPTRIHVSLSLNTIESLFDLAKYRFWSGEAITGVRRPVFIRVRTAYSNAAT